MKIQINIRDSHILIILLLMTAASAMGLVVAYGGTQPSIVGHTWGEMECSGCITTSNLADSSVTSAKIADGSITDADISATAAISGSKITGTVPAATSAGNADTVDGYHASEIVSWGGVCDPVWSGCSTCCGAGTDTCNYRGKYLTLMGTTVCYGMGILDSCGSKTCTDTSCCPTGWCPFFYSWDGTSYVKDTTFIYKLDSPEKEAVQLRELRLLDTSGAIKAKIVEEEAETSYIDRIQLVIADTKDDQEARYELDLVYASSGLEKISASDNDYLVMSQGDEVYLEFGKAPTLEDGWTRTTYIKAEGYYVTA